jgi:hypothetical protein
MGLESAMLAKKGLHGPVTVIEGRYGYFNAFSEPTDIAKLTDGLGQKWISSGRAQVVRDARHTPGGGAGDSGLKRARIDAQSITHVTFGGAPHPGRSLYRARKLTVMGGKKARYGGGCAHARHVEPARLQRRGREGSARAQAGEGDGVDRRRARARHVSGRSRDRVRRRALQESDVGAQRLTAQSDDLGRCLREVQPLHPLAHRRIAGRAIMDAVADLENQSDMARIATLLACI